MSGLIAGLQQGLSIPARFLDRLYRSFCGLCYWGVGLWMLITHTWSRPFSLVADLMGSFWPAAGRVIGRCGEWISSNSVICAVAFGLLIVGLVIRITFKREHPEPKFDTGRTASTFLLAVVLLQQTVPAVYGFWVWVGIVLPTLIVSLAISAVWSRGLMLFYPLSTALGWPFSEVWNAMVGDVESRSMARGGPRDPVYVIKVNQAPEFQIAQGALIIRSEP
jgi:hypothetical protein